LDELSPEIIRKNVQELKDLSMNSLKKEVNKNLIIEVSGIKPEEISKYIIKGIDLISTSYSITKSNWIDLSIRYIN
jgi:nicotinate-nucleotide pyrophosphorylase (carboxylating)